MRKPLLLVVISLVLLASKSHGLMLTTGDVFTYAFNISDLDYRSSTSAYSSQVFFDFGEPDFLQEQTFEWDPVTGEFVMVPLPPNERLEFDSSESILFSAYRDQDSLEPFAEIELTGGSGFEFGVSLLPEIVGTYIDDEGVERPLYESQWADFEGYFSLTMLNGEALLTDIQLSISNGTDNYYTHFSTVPVPGTLMLMGIGLLAAGAGTSRNLRML